MKRRLLGTFLALLTIRTALAQTGAQAYFEQGMKAFRSDRFEVALDAFESARRMGMDHPSLYYNMGVSAYRLGRYRLARESFLKTAEDSKLRQVAHYNLGLVALKQNDHVAAAKWFDQALAGENDKIRALAATQLERLVHSPVRNGFGLVGVTLGSDDNVLDPDAATTNEEDDSFVELFAAGSYVFGAPPSGWRLEASAYRLDYSQVDDLDFNAVQFGLAKVADLGGWRGEVGAKGDRTSLGGDEYLATGSLEVKGRRQLGKVTRLSARYRFDSIAALDSGFDYLEGERHTVELDGSRDLGRLTVGLAYEFETNDRENLETVTTSGTTFSNFSPLRHGLSLRGDLRVTEALAVRGRLRYRVSDYDEPDILADGTSVSRSDDQIRFDLRLEGQLDGGWRPFAEYEYTDNSSNIDIYEYQRNILAAGVTWTY